MRVLLSNLLVGLAIAQEWPYYGGDAGGMKYSPLRQITAANVQKLQVAWTYHTGEMSDGKTEKTRSAFEATPLMIGDRLYFTTPLNRLVALDATTGREVWSFDPKLDLQRTYSLYLHRGAAWWTDGRQKRLLYGTLDGRLFSIDAETGRQAWSTNLRAGMADDFPNRAYGLTSPPSVYGNLVIVGSLASDGEPQGPNGDIRAFHIATGELAWRFHVIPQPGESGYETWPPGSTQGRGGVNAWAPLSVDHQRGLVFVPLTSPATDRYGGDRHGDNLFGDSLVALNAKTGQRVWHFQTVHHDLWDYDLPAQPNLVTLKGEPYVAQITKTGLLFVFHRLTGQPYFPIEERVVPPSEIAGEKTSPTQPFPVKPAPFARNSFRLDELRAGSPFCEEITRAAISGGPYTPIGPKPTIVFPGTNGGANWGGASFDPRSETLYVNSMDVGMVVSMVSRPGALPRTRGVGTPDSRFWDKDRQPCQKPPWGHLTAINLRTGDFRWRIPLGAPQSGSPNIGGSIVTAGGIVFIGATNDAKFRAFDSRTGRLRWQTDLPASAFATPMTFSAQGKQYVVIAAGGGNDYSATVADALIAYRLP